ncbi:hypothetical protein QBC47DRAFT_118721 [Echria macrotheca]|uniref:Uncharacterized protein n=1 Tax=Echria macrotheca TaxID=438768 RepID=A0AAJ0F6V9_9PEZI|nr:hypothetical protein QBC47DRAFT_118721 [Echria macrotheca]
MVHDVVFFIALRLPLRSAKPALAGARCCVFTCIAKMSPQNSLLSARKIRHTHLRPFSRSSDTQALYHQINAFTRRLEQSLETQTSSSYSSCPVTRLQPGSNPAAFLRLRPVAQTPRRRSKNESRKTLPHESEHSFHSLAAPRSIFPYRRGVDVTKDLVVLNTYGRSITGLPTRRNSAPAHDPAGAARFSRTDVPRHSVRTLYKSICALPS